MTFPFVELPPHPIKNAEAMTDVARAGMHIFGIIVIGSIPDLCRRVLRRGCRRDRNNPPYAPQAAQPNWATGWLSDHDRRVRTGSSLLPDIARIANPAVV